MKPRHPPFSMLCCDTSRCREPSLGPAGLAHPRLDEIPVTRAVLVANRLQGRTAPLGREPADGRHREVGSATLIKLFADAVYEVKRTLHTRRRALLQGPEDPFRQRMISSRLCIHVRLSPPLTAFFVDREPFGPRFFPRESRELSLMRQQCPIRCSLQDSNRCELDCDLEHGACLARSTREP